VLSKKSPSPCLPDGDRFSALHHSHYRIGQPLQRYALGKTVEFDTTTSQAVRPHDRPLPEGAKVRKRRILVTAGRSGKGLLTEPTTAAQPWQREPLLMPLCGHSLRSAATAYGAPLRHSFDACFWRILGCRSYLSRVLCAEDERWNDTMDIGGWLRGLGLERYEQAFRENERP
jgi:hypothetical protein